jgi:hypothetical protein
MKVNCTIGHRSIYSKMPTNGQQVTFAGHAIKNGMISLPQTWQKEDNES